MDDEPGPGGDGAEHHGPLSVAAERNGSRLVVSLTGELDLAAVDAFASAFGKDWAAGGERIEIDARELTFVDSAGLQALLSARRVTVASGGSFVLVHVSPALRRMLELSGLAEVFTDPEAR